MLRYIFSLLISIGVSYGFAQQAADSTTVKPKKDYKPSMLIMGYNAVPLVRTVFFSGSAAQNGQVGVDFANNLFMVDFGVQRTERTGSNYSYINEGTFYRLGVETNVLKNASDANGLTLGLRYARSRFSDEMEMTDDFGFGEVTINTANNVAKSRWWELTFGLNVKVYKQIYFGYLIRYKLYKVTKDIGQLKPYDLPGFGLNENDTSVGFDYYIRWILPFGDKAQVVEE